MGSGPFRILIADDSAVVRQLVTEVLSAHEELEVVGSAANGRYALKAHDQLHPDLVLLDVEMPEMNGLETLRELRAADSSALVLMFSSVTQANSRATVEALLLGATDCLPKPSGMKDLDETRLYLEEALVPRILELCRAPRGARSATLRPNRRPRTQVELEVIVMAASTGGPRALGEVLKGLPAQPQVPILIVQHLPAQFTAFLADRLAHGIGRPVRAGQDGERPAPGDILIAPGDSHMRLTRDGGGLRLQLDSGEPVNSCRPSADILFSTAAAVCGRRALGIVLTGMGRDGRDGCGDLHGAGATVLVQDEASSSIWGMPGSVAIAGFADAVLPLAQLAAEIARGVRGTGPGRERTARPR